MKLENLNKVLKSRLKSFVFSSCILKPSCSIEIAKQLYGDKKKHYKGIEHYEDRYISKILNQLRRFELVEIVDYKNCKHIRAKHFYFTERKLEKLTTEIEKNLFGKKGLDKHTKVFVRKHIKKLFKNRRAFYNFFMKYPNLINFRTNFLLKVKKS